MMNRDDYIDKQQKIKMVAPIVSREEANAINREAAINFELAYCELIMAVGKKHPGETRHETALRYIREAEKSASNPSKPK